MILCDGVHLTSDRSLLELVRCARRLGWTRQQRRRWLQVSHRGLVHYDLLGGCKRRVARNTTRRHLATSGLRVAPGEAYPPSPSLKGGGVL